MSAPSPEDFQVWLRVDAAIADEAERLGGSKRARFDSEWRARAFTSLLGREDLLAPAIQFSIEGKESANG